MLFGFVVCEFVLGGYFLVVDLVGFVTFDSVAVNSVVHNAITLSLFVSFALWGLI